MMTAVAATPTPRGHLLSRSDGQRSMMRAGRGLCFRPLPAPGGGGRAAGCRWEVPHARLHDQRGASAIARLLSAVERDVLDHPLHELIERDARVRREFGHERRLGHAGLRVDFETNESPRPLDAIVVAE